MELNYTEDDVQQALNAVANGMSVRMAHREYGVTRGIIRGRIDGHLSRSEAQESYQRLSLVQEQCLADWVLTQEALGQNPTHSQIRAFAGRVLAARGDAIPLGKRWMQGFLRRNPVLKTKRQFRINSTRINSTTTKKIKPQFQKLAIPRIKAIKPENHWNMNKTGIIEDQGVNGLVVGSTNRCFVQKKQPGSKAQTSFIECISATGVVLQNG